MKYAITVLEFSMVDAEMELTTIPAGVYFRKVDDRNDRDEYISVSGEFKIPGKVVKKMTNHFSEVNESEYKRNNVNILDAVKAIDKIIKESDVPATAIIDLLKSHYKIIDFREYNYPYPGSINIPVIPHVQPAGCTMCGRVDGGACFNTVCPNRYNITYTR